jgi:hypothetical protein
MSPMATVRAPTGSLYMHMVKTLAAARPNILFDLTIALPRLRLGRALARQQER